jgi:hypothetical protein
MTTCSFPRPSKFYPNWIFGLKNKPSGNPAGNFALLPCNLKPNSISGLPDGKSQFGLILDCNGKCWCSFGITYCLFVHVVAIWYILWPSRRSLWSLTIFFPLWYIVPRKIWQPCSIQDCLLPLLRTRLQYYKIGT